MIKYIILSVLLITGCQPSSKEVVDIVESCQEVGTPTIDVYFTNFTSGMTISCEWDK